MSAAHRPDASVLMAMGSDLAQQTEHMEPFDRVITAAHALSTLLKLLPPGMTVECTLAALRLVVGGALLAPAGSVSVSFTINPPDQQKPLG